MPIYPWDKRKEKFPYQPNFENEIKELENEMTNALREGRSFSYGFAVVSVNGQSISQVAFNQPETEGVQPEIKETEVEPLVDVIEEKDKTKVLIELPGVEKKDIQLTEKDNILEVSVDAEQRRYRKKIELSHPVKNPKAEYKNGVLEISIKKDQPKDVEIN